MGQVNKIYKNAKIYGILSNSSVASCSFYKAVKKHVITYFIKPLWISSIQKKNVQILYSIGYCYDHSKLFLKKCITNTILGSILAYNL